MAGDKFIVALENVSRHFSRHTALSNVSFTLERGEILGIIGRSGAGKSTLLRCLSGLERPDQGSVIIDGQDITGLSDNELLPLRRKIGLVFQHFNLINSRTILHNVALPLKIAGVDKSTRLTRAKELLDLVGLPGRENAYPAQLSGGQKQRVGIARALAGDPALLLCDEATSALDPETTRSILELLRTINQKFALSIILITHEMSVIQNLASKVLVMDAGRIVESGKVVDVFTQPQASMTQQLLQDTMPQVPRDLQRQLCAEPNPATTHLLIRFDLVGATVRLPVIAWLQKDHAIEAILIEGRTFMLGDTGAGTMFLGIPTARADIALSALASYGINYVESLGYVTLPS